MKIALWIMVLLFTAPCLAGWWSRNSDARTRLPEDVFQTRKSWAADLSFGYNQNEGNVEQVTGFLGLSLSKLMPDYSLYFDSSMLYSRFGTLVVQNQKNAVVRVDYPVNERFKWFAFNTHAENEFLRLKYRTTLGVGPWYDFVGKDWKNGISLAPTFSYEEFFRQSIERKTTMSLRNYFVSKLNEQSTFGFDFFYVPKWDEISDYHLFFQPFFETKIYKNLVSLKLSYTLEYDNRPAQGIEKADSEYMTSLTFHLGE